MIQIASSHFHEMFYPGGAFSLESALYWALRSRSVKDEHPSAAQLRVPRHDGHDSGLMADSIPE
jgi:hypothetical protein